MADELVDGGVSEPFRAIFDVNTSKTVIKMKTANTVNFLLYNKPPFFAVIKKGLPKKNNIFILKLRRGRENKKISTGIALSGSQVP